jgi:hypothetical protein
MVGNPRPELATVKAHLFRWPTSILVIGLFSLLACGCAVPDGGFVSDQGVGFGLSYYEPYGIRYGGWGAGYYVGPTRRGAVYRANSGWAGRHAYRPAPAFRTMPSLPPRGRPGGFTPRAAGGRFH